MKLIVAVDKNWGIGKKNDLLFSIPEDMKFFREKTANAVVIMGYNTLLSFPKSKPLKNRVNIVLAPDDVERDDCIIVHSLDELKTALLPYDTNNVFVIGGAMFYRTMYPYCDQAFVTRVDAQGGAEVFFDNLDNLANWSRQNLSEPIVSNGYTIQFTVYNNSRVLKF